MKKQKLVYRDNTFKEEERDQHIPGSFGCHEVLHVTSVIASLFDREIREHAAILINPKWLKKAEKISEDIHELYQMIGMVHLTV